MATDWIPQPPHPQGPPRPPSAPAWVPARTRLPSTAEALGWGGGITTLVGVIAVTADAWGQALFHGWALFGVLAAATAVLGVAAGQVSGVAEGPQDRTATSLAQALGVFAGLVGVWTTYVAVDTAVGGDVVLGVLAASTAAAAMAAARGHRTGRDGWWALASASAAVAAWGAAATGTEDAVVRACAVAAAGAAALVAATATRPAATRLTQGTALAVMWAAAETALVLDPIPAAAVLIVLAAAGVAAIAWSTGGRAVGLWSTGAAALLALTASHEALADLLTLRVGILATGVAMTATCAVLAHRARR